MSEFDDRDALRPEKKNKRNDPEPDGDASIRSDGGNDVEIEDGHDEQQNQVPAAENALEVGSFGRRHCGRRGDRDIVRQERFLAPQNHAEHKNRALQTPPGMTSLSSTKMVRRQFEQRSASEGGPYKSKTKPAPLKPKGAAPARARATLELVACCADEGCAAVLLGFRERRGNFLEDSQVLIDVRFLVLHGNGPLFVPPIRLGEDAAIDHGEPIVAPEIDINLGPVAIVANFLRVEHQRAVDAGAGDVGPQPGFLDDGAIAFGEFFAEIAHASVGFAREDFAERSEASGHGDAVGVVRAAMKNLVLRDEVHDRAACAKSAERQSAADGLRKADDIRLHAEEFACAAPSQLCAGLHLVEDEQRAILAADVAQALEETRLRDAETDVHHDGLENDGGDLAGIFAEAALDAREIVKGCDDDIGERGFRNARAARNAGWGVGIAVVFGLGLHADESGVVEAVIAAFEFQDFFAAGRGTSDAAGVHGDFRAARTEANHLDGITLADFFGEFPFLIVGHAEGRAAVKFLLNSFDHGGMAMAGHERAKTKIVINVFVAIEIVNAAAFSVFYENRIRLVMAVVAGNTQRNPFESALVSRGGLGRALFVSGKFLL